MSGSQGGFAARLRRLVASDFRASERDRRFLTLLNTGVAAGFGVFGAFLPDLWSWNPYATIPMTAALAALQLLLAWRLLDRPETVGQLLIELAEGERRLAGERAASSVAEMEAKRLAALQSWLLSVHVAQGAALSPNGPTHKLQHELFDQFLFPLCANPFVMFGFSQEDVWNFAVYLHEDAAGELRPAWRRADLRHPSRRPAGAKDGAPWGRCWRPGNSHVGFAFYRRQAIITPDGTSPEFRKLFGYESGAAKEYDAVVYRSFASIPFFDGATDDRPLGVVVGTSSRAGAFTEETTLPLRHAAAVFTTIAPAIRRWH